MSNQIKLAPIFEKSTTHMNNFVNYQNNVKLKWAEFYNEIYPALVISFYCITSPWLHVHTAYQQNNLKSSWFNSLCSWNVSQSVAPGCWTVTMDFSTSVKPVRTQSWNPTPMKSLTRTCLEMYFPLYKHMGFGWGDMSSGSGFRGFGTVIG